MFSALTSCLARTTLLGAASILLLFLWDMYKCPRSFAVASACLRNSMLTRVLAIVLHWHLSFCTPEIGFCIELGQSHNIVGHHFKREFLLWALWLLLTTVLSLLSVLDQVGKSVPGLLASEKIWVSGITLGIGAIQALLSSFVVPAVAHKLVAQQHSLTAIANLLMSVLYPTAVILYLDTGCLGNWVALWSPCRRHEEVP